MDQEKLAKLACWAVDEQIHDGMRVGLGTGRTVFHALRYLGEKIQRGQLKNIQTIATSWETSKVALELGFPLSSPLDPIWEKGLDLAIDGVDQITLDAWGIKGGGGAHLFEKLIFTNAQHFIVLADHTKVRPQLDREIPLEIHTMAYRLVRYQLAPEFEVRLRPVEGKRPPLMSDNGHIIADLFTSKAWYPLRQELLERLDALPGILAHGLFTHPHMTLYHTDLQGNLLKKDL